MKNKQTESIGKALDKLRIELPSWGFANTRTRFGKFIQLAAASTIEEKFSDAAQVHAVTGACPTLALHVQWDLPKGLQDAGKVKELAKKHGVKPGSINPNVFQDQEYKYGSVGNPDASIRRKALTIFSIASESRKRSIAATSRPGLRTDPIIPGRRAFESELAILKRD